MTATEITTDTLLRISNSPEYRHVPLRNVLATHLSRSSLFFDPVKGNCHDSDFAVFTQFCAKIHT